jgi:protein-tyrosine kinase
MTKETPSTMSTIEKAAARLAALQRAKGTPPSAPKGNLARRVGNAAAGYDGGSQPLSSLKLARSSLCSIDVALLRERGYLAPDAPRSQLAQEMRRIKRPLLLNIQKSQTEAQGQADPPSNLIMITSALPGEGKTFTAINLAISVAAELDRHVLLVDADVARGDVARQLGIEPSRGLSDLLQEHHHLAEDGVLGSNVEGLSVLLAGSHAEQVDELFASEMMKTVMGSLAAMDPNRVIIIDSPPLLATTEAAVLARRVGQVVLVVEANKTPQETVAQAIAQLEGCGNVSLVLNKTTGRSSIGYGYGYGYGYGSDLTHERNGGGRRVEEAG